MILVKRMSPMIMPVRAAAVLHRYFDITLDSGLDPIIAEHRYWKSIGTVPNWWTSKPCWSGPRA